MSPEQAVTKLQTFYGRKLTDGQVAFYADALSSFNFNLIDTAINRCFREHKQFPTTATILKYLMEARDIESRKEKKAEPKTTHEPQEPSKPADPEYVKESFRLLHLAWEQGKTNQERIKNNTVDVKIKNFVDTVRAMREAQRLYSKTKKQADLIEAKKLETAVDFRMDELEAEGKRRG